MRPTQAAEEAWREPIAELEAAAAKARNDIIGLRASLETQNQPRGPDVAAITERIDRLERAMTAHTLPGPIRGSLRESGSRQTVAARDRAPALPDLATEAKGGHIISLRSAAE